MAAADWGSQIRTLGVANRILSKRGIGTRPRPLPSRSPSVNHHGSRQNAYCDEQYGPDDPEHRGRWH